MLARIYSHCFVAAGLLQRYLALTFGDLNAAFGIPLWTDQVTNF